MNKKFFAALASATMAFSATGSLAVFAQDFEDENNVVAPGDVMPVSKEVAWNEDNFGALAGIALTGTNSDELEPTVFTLVSGATAITVKDGKVKTDDLKNVTTIDLPATFKGEIKGLEYFTGLTTFGDTKVNTTEKIENEALDFSANTKLATLAVTKAPKLAEITLPEADEDDVYHLATLTLADTELTTLDVAKYGKLANLTVTNSKLSKLDLSALTKVNAVTVTDNSNLEEVTLHNGKKGDVVEVETLVLSDNALETVNLDYINVTGSDAADFSLDGNHIGALDLSKTTVPTGGTLGTQTFYVSENAKNVNLKEAIPGLKATRVTGVPATAYDLDTGILTLDGTDGEYTYNTDVNGATTKTLTVKLKSANPMNRLYNPNSGEHFYTADIKEKEALVALGWNDEGYGWVAPKTGVGAEVYRLYNPNAGDHHYTTIKDEKDTLVAYGWKDEGIGWYSANGTDVVTVYRQYNPFANGAGSHNYTTDKAENDYLVSLGWTPEGTAWFALK